MTLPPLSLLRDRLLFQVREERAAGRDVEAIEHRLRSQTVDSYDALDALAVELQAAPMRADWPFLEPDEWDPIVAECEPDRPLGRVASVPDASGRAEAAFLGSVCGCILGKPVEMDPTLEDLRTALTPFDEWPIRSYLTDAACRSLRVVPWQVDELARERIDHVAPDDDINYTVLGLRVLERHGVAFTRENLRSQWLLNLPVYQTFGPERAFLATSATAMLEPYEPMGDVWSTWRPPPVTSAWMRWNPGVELCGALIRADAHGYACLGHPALAAELAWRDAGMTHRRTGLYGAMWVAAAIAAMPICSSPLEAFALALAYVPQRSRFADAVRFALDAVPSAATWEDGYDAIHARFGDHGHCLVLQEVGTLVNTLHFARDVGDGICLQVMQGNDTDSFGATAGSLLGAWFGPGALEDRWLAPFGDRIHLSLAMEHERSLAALAARMGALPALVT